MKFYYKLHTIQIITLLQVNGFIALSGGVGTMEELTEIMTWCVCVCVNEISVLVLKKEGKYEIHGLVCCQ